MANNSEKKHNKIVSWFLGLPKWGKILLVGGSVAGVATAVTVPTVLVLTQKEKETAITYAEAKAYVEQYFISETSTKTLDDVNSKIDLAKGLSFKFVLNSSEKKQDIISMLNMWPGNIIKHSNNPELTAETMPDNCTIKITDVNSYKTDLKNGIAEMETEEKGSGISFIEDTYWPTKENVLGDIVTEEEGTTFAKINTDLIVHYEKSDQGGYCRYTNKGLIKSMEMKIDNNVFGGVYFTF